MKDTDRLDFGKMLAAHYLFERLPEEEIQHLVSIAEYFEYPTGEILIRQGYLGSAIYVFSEGRASVRFSHNRSTDKKHEVARLKTGDICGEMSVILNEPATASVLALQRVSAFIINRKVFEKMVQKNAPFANAVYALALERKSIQIEKTKK